MRDFTKTEVWRSADDLAFALYMATRQFPLEELHGIIGQIREASCAVPERIAEGASRETKKDHLHFLYAARGALGKTRYLIHLSGRLGYLSAAQVEQLEGQAVHVFGRLQGFIRSVEHESGIVNRTTARFGAV